MSSAPAVESETLRDDLTSLWNIVVRAVDCEKATYPAIAKAFEEMAIILKRQQPDRLQQLSQALRLLSRLQEALENVLIGEPPTAEAMQQAIKDSQDYLRVTSVPE